MLVVWLALAIWGSLTIGGLAFAADRGFRLYRQGRRALARFGSELERINAAAFEIEEQLARAEEGGGQLRIALDRLRRTRARLDVQFEALREARAQLGWAIPLAPRR
jgi:chromosome segregation ATPase